MGTRAHRRAGPRRLRVAVISVSSTRSLEDDKSGQWIGKRFRKMGHELIDRQVVDDDREAIRNSVAALLREATPHVLVLTGGTGIARRDVTIEAVRPLFAKELTAFATLFALLSFEAVDAAAMLSRAAAGIIGHSVVFCLPGSLNACKLACKNLIFPEMVHLAKHAQE